MLSISQQEWENIVHEIIVESLKQSNILTPHMFQKIKNRIYKKYSLSSPINHVYFIEAYFQGIQQWKYEYNEKFHNIIIKRKVRSLSGITVISLFTKPQYCPWKCIYCPSFPEVPKSYIPEEPACQRAILNNYDPVLQIHNRLCSLEITGHVPQKNDVRIIGETWSAYSQEYRRDFITKVYDAFTLYESVRSHIEDKNIHPWKKFWNYILKNDFSYAFSASLEEAKKKNEHATYRVIGIAIETRPDSITMEELKLLREYGITRVEIGYQTTIDEIHTLNNRWHTNREIAKAMRLLKDAWLKVVAHFMPNLFGSTVELDKQAFQKIFEDADFCPDEIKIYPTVVTLYSPLEALWRKGEYIPYDDETLIDLIADLEMMVPEWVRINRVYRDIPSNYILAWCRLSNLQQLVEKRIKEKGGKCVDIRSREVKDKTKDLSQAVFHSVCYSASWGKEYFLTFEDKEDKTLFALLRLRFPSKNHELISLFPELQGCAIIREVHTFWKQICIGARSWCVQHQWFWKKLIFEAEKLAKEYGYHKIAITSWIGVREYYRKLWYVQEWEYMVKTL